MDHTVSLKTRSSGIEVYRLISFELFHRWNFQSEWINKIAKFVFPMYILDRLIRSIIEYFIPVPDLVQEGLWRYLCMVGYVLIVMLTAVIIEVIRKKYSVMWRISCFKASTRL